MFELTNSSATNSFLTNMESNTKENYKNAALQLARKICTEAIWHKEQCNWLTLSSENSFQYPVDYAKMMSPAFYDGIAGVILFLTAAYSVEKDAIILTTINGAIATLQLQEATADNEEKYGNKLSFHTGYCGSAYCMYYAGTVLNNKLYKDAALQLLHKATELDVANFGTDVIDGAAGAIPVLLFFYNRTKEAKYLQFAVQLGDYLLQKATVANNTISWVTMPEIEHNLTGYAHGTSGMAHCFAELYAVTNDEQYSTVVEQIVAYEKIHFSQKENNWPDFRNFNTATNDTATVVCSCAWCHGAPGIGLSRIRCYEVLQNDAYLADATTAAITTKKDLKLNYGFNFSLCHGLTGNSELLQAMYELTKNEEWKNEVTTIANVLSNDYIPNSRVLPSGLQSQKPVIDFMLGDAGIGYFLLRQYDATAFKNMLLFTSS